MRNNYTGNSPKIAGWRNELFRSHTPVYNNLFGNYDYHKKPDDSMTDFQKAMFLTSMIGQTLTPIAKGVKDIIDDNNSTSSGNVDNRGGYNYGDIELSSGNMKGRLDSADSFSTISGLETEATDQLNNFQQNYSAEIETNIAGIKDALAVENVKQGLQFANVTLDTTKLVGSNLQINTSDLASIDTAMTTIDADIAKVNKFISADIASAITSLTTKSGELAKQIGTLDAQIKSAEVKESNGETPSPSSSELKSRLEEIKANKEKVDAAKTALEENGDVRNAVNSIITDLGEQKATLADIKLTLEALADKKYDLAKKQEKAVEDSINTMDKILDKQKKGETLSAQDKQKYQTAYNNYSAAITSLAAAGVNEIANSKGKKISITHTTVDEKYQSDFQTNGAPVGGGEADKSVRSDVSQRNTELISRLSNMAIEDTVEIDNKQFKKVAENVYEDESGEKYTHLTLMSIVIASSIRPNES